ncbi:hypothetical protein NQD34_005805 [Periophthalmus magnuspinnatus]|nr:hypothetical protein NQD34_005805 [Periophthalmus magnuspinnatus]
MELIHKNILPVHGSIKTAFIVPEFSKASDELSSAEEDSVDSVDSPLPCGTLTLTVAPCRLQDRSVSPLKPPAPVSTSAHGTTPENKQKINSEHCVQKHKKTKDDKPKMKKLKYHEYVPPDHKGEKEAPTKLDSSYAKLLQQQQLFLHLQILSQQQRQQSSTHTQPHPPTDQEQLKSTPVLPDAPLATSVKAEEKSASLPPNLEELKVAELKAELKLRGLPVSGTKSDLIERLRGAHAAGSGARAQPAGGGREPGAEGAAKAAKTTVNGQLALAAKPKCSTLQIKNSGHNCSKSTSLTSPENSAFITEPKEFKTEMPDHEPALTPQINISIKEEQLSPIPTSAPVEKTPKTPTSPAASLDKDSMLRQKDRQIEELKRLLLHNQRLVDVLKMKLEMRRRSEEQKTETILHLRVAPPDKNGELHVKIKQEDADDDNTGTLGQLDPKLTNGEQNGRHQQAVHRLLLQQQSKLHSRPQAVQTHNQRDENRHKQEKVCQERKKKAPRQQQRVELDSQQILVKQERKDQQNIQIQTKTELEKAETGNRTGVS